MSGRRKSKLGNGFYLYVYRYMWGVFLWKKVVLVGVNLGLYNISFTVLIVAKDHSLKSWSW